MQFTNRQVFPADPHVVHAMVTDEDFLSHAAVEMGALDARVAADATRSAVHASVEPPAGVRPFVGPRLSIVQEMTWGQAAADGSRDGILSITVAGAPVTMRGTARLEPTASGSTITYDGELTVNVPLVGARIEQAAAPALLEALEAQGRVGRTWLTR
ncbi:MAG: DUF2505 domain-containing protein [Actinomycetes bacterium]